VHRRAAGGEQEEESSETAHVWRRLYAMVVALCSPLGEHRAMDGTRILAIILVFAAVSAAAYVFGRQQNANAVAVSSAFLRTPFASVGIQP